MPELPPHNPNEPEEPIDSSAPERPPGASADAGAGQQVAPDQGTAGSQPRREDAATEPQSTPHTGGPGSEPRPDEAETQQQPRVPEAETEPHAAGAARSTGSPAPEAEPDIGAATPRRLTRSPDDRVLAGVAGGLGRYFSVDPILFRLGFVLLTAAGGIGLVVYLAGWVLMPVEGREHTPRSRAWTLALAVLLVLLAAPWFDEPFFAFGWPILMLALLAGFGYLLWRAAGGNASDRPLVAAGIGLLVLAGALVAAGLVGVAAAALGAGPLLAGLLVLCGIALAVGAFYGGARWLMLPALVIALPLAFVAAADLDIDGAVGERYHRPATVAEAREGFDIGAGDLRVDLTDVDFPAGTTRVPIDVDFGSASILVPADVCVASELDFGIGHADVLGDEIAGLDLSQFSEPALAASGTESRPSVVLIAADVGIGNVEVFSARDGHIDLPRPPRDRFFDRGDRWDFDNHPQLACDEEEL